MGGYPKIAIVILADLSKIAQLPIGSQINFKQIALKEAEILYKDKIFNFNKQRKNIKII
jgi:allophanate hydrolase subunit 2